MFIPKLFIINLMPKHCRKTSKFHVKKPNSPHHKKKQKTRKFELHAKADRPQNYLHFRCIPCMRVKVTFIISISKILNLFTLLSNKFQITRIVMSEALSKQ